MSKNLKVTVLSMCYNKADTIQRCYESLRRQTCLDFEWIIVNDGSTDNVLEIASSFKDDLFPIKFINKANEGIAPTWNRGVKESSGEYIFRVDPDDFIYEDAIQIIVEYSAQVEADSSLCGLVFLSTFEDRSLVGYHPFTEEVVRSNFIEFRIKYKAVGDRAEVCKRSVFIKNPWPNYPQEKFYPESVMWNSIACKYDALYIQKAIYIREYGDTCISANNSAVMRRNPLGYMDSMVSHLRILSTYPLNWYRFKRAFRAGCNYFRYGMYSDMKLGKMVGRLPLYYALLTTIPGVVMHFVDRCFPNLIRSVVSFLSNEKSILKRDRT